MTPSTEWVIYLTASGATPASHGVCSSAEWDGRGFSDRHTLVRRVSGTEGQAEQAARRLQPPPVRPAPKAVPSFGRLTDRLPPGHGCGNPNGAD